MLTKVCGTECISWAAQSETIRPKMLLLVLFNVNIPVLHGEGMQKTFRQVQEEITKQYPSRASPLGTVRIKAVPY